jgi:hypothetical protein
MAKNKKAPAGDLWLLPGLELGFLGQLEQIEFLGSVNSRPAVVDPQFVENIFGVGAKGVEGDDQLASNFGAA